jgi:signal transduction histidine kinase
VESGDIGLPAEEAGLARWLRQYVLFRWLVTGAILIGTLVGRVALGVHVPLLPVLSVAGVVACYNVLFSLWQRRHGQHSEESLAEVRWRRRFAFCQIVADLIALTALLHFVGGIETPIFLFYFFHVVFGAVLLDRRDVYLVTVLAIGLFVALVAAEFLGWIPHNHLEGLVPPNLYRSQPYVGAVLMVFVPVLVVSALGATAVVAELRSRWSQRAGAIERELEEIGGKLADMDRMRVFFLGLASHDLKTPLAVVSNYLQAILDGFVGEVNEKQRRWMERANVRVLELVRLVDDFVDVSQLAPQRILAEMRQVALDEAVQLSVEEMRDRAEEKCITLQVRVPEHLPSVHAAPRRIQQAITSLLDNAIKCSPRKGEVGLLVREQGNALRIDVVDTGPCVPANYVPRVFEDYLQVQRKEFVPGAGLGLSAARKIVEVHGGEIWVESPYHEDGRGSCFSFTLPRTMLASGSGEE